MSNRRRISRTPTSYADRLQRQRQRPPRQRQRPPGSPPPMPDRPVTGWLPAVLVTVALVAEAGHLASAYVEWPQSTVRGIYHVMAGAALGVVAALAATAARRAHLAVAAVVVMSAGPVVWLGGALLAAPAYREVPAALAAGIIATEIVLAAALARTWRGSPPPAGSPKTRTGPRRYSITSASSGASSDSSSR